MKVFICEDNYENIMTSIYDAWVCALKIGHANVRIERKTVAAQTTLFEEYVCTQSDMKKVEKVTRSIQNKISWEAYIWIYRAALSMETDAPDAIYRFMILGFQAGSSVTGMLMEPAVMRMMELNRKVGNEAHLFREFARFTSIAGQIYVCHLEPKSNVILFVAEEFADRMPSENYIIIDDNRKLAAVHPKDENCYLRKLNEEEFEELSRTEYAEDDYTQMWRTFFDAIAIKQRINPVCQRNHFPKWMREHATEFRR